MVSTVVEGAGITIDAGGVVGGEPDMMSTGANFSVAK